MEEMNPGLSTHPLESGCDVAIPHLYKQTEFKSVQLIDISITL